MLISSRRCPLPGYLRLYAEPITNAFSGLPPGQPIQTCSPIEGGSQMLNAPARVTFSGSRWSAPAERTRTACLSALVLFHHALAPECFQAHQLGIHYAPRLLIAAFSVAIRSAGSCPTARAPGTARKRRTNLVFEAVLVNTGNACQQCRQIYGDAARVRSDFHKTQGAQTGKHRRFLSLSASLIAF